MPKIYLGIGSNMGDREANIKKALHYLKENNITIIKQSSIIETEPVGGPPQDKYLNLVISAQTSLSPHALLNTLKAIEHSLGRIKTVQDGPRPIDLDILLYDDIQLATNELTIPHIRMLSRDFVMQPLKEIDLELFNNLKTKS